MGVEGCIVARVIALIALKSRSFSNTARDPQTPLHI